MEVQRLNKVYFLIVTYQTALQLRREQFGKVSLKYRSIIMPRGYSPKREREYKKLVTEFHKEHRYPDREEEVAARIVNKQRREHGETKSHQPKNSEN